MIATISPVFPRVQYQQKTDNNGRQCDQQVCVAGETFEFDADEEIRTEYSHKYTIEGFAEIAGESGLTLRRHWSDDDDLFAVLHLAVR